MRETKVYVVRDFDSTNYRGKHVGVCDSLDVARELADMYLGDSAGWSGEWVEVDYDKSQTYRPFTVYTYGASNETHEMIITEETLITEYVMSRPIAGV